MPKKLIFFITLFSFLSLGNCLEESKESSLMKLLQAKGKVASFQTEEGCEISTDHHHKINNELRIWYCPRCKRIRSMDHYNRCKKCAYPL